MSYNPKSLTAFSGRHTVIRMHDFIETSEPAPRTLVRQPGRNELLSQLLDAADAFLDASGRRGKRDAEMELLRVVDRVKRRLGIGSADEWQRQGKRRH